MASHWAHWDRIVLVAICLILGASTGLAAAVPGTVPAVTGHTAFVTAVRLVDVPELPDPNPMAYGLATYRDIRMFGLWEVERAVRPAQDRMVFVWSASASDPREAPVLQTTGDFARVRDLNGAVWTVYEFSYLDGANLRHAYGVRVGETRTADDPEIGEGGHYNYVLAYRTEKLLGPPLAQKVRVSADEAAAVAEQAGVPAETVPQEVLDLAPDFGTSRGATDAQGAPKLAFGLGTVPLALERADPALPLPADVVQPRPLP